jgi:hypothetical protein
LYEGSKLVEMAKKQQSYEEMFMKVNPLQLGGASKGKSKDIHLTNIDVSFGSNRILCVLSGSTPFQVDLYLLGAPTGPEPISPWRTEGVTGK